jgi:hypothetical protein
MGKSLVAPIPDDERVPVEVMDLAASMAKSSRAAQEISDRTGISKDRVVRLLMSGGLTYSAKAPRQPRWSGRRGR